MLHLFDNRKIRKNVEEHGCAFVTGEDGPPYAYTVGLWESLSAPELVVYGLTKHDAKNVIAFGLQELKEGRLILSDGVRSSGVVEKVDCIWRKVDPSQLNSWRFGSWYRYRHHRTGRYDGLEMYQLVWPDEKGLFPWEPGCNPLARLDQRPLYLPEDPDDPDKWAAEIAQEMGYPG
jgi:hypothetical protein